MSSAEALQVVVNGKPTDITDLKVAELKVELKKLGISTAGNKAELLDKLRKVNNPTSSGFISSFASKSIDLILNLTFEGTTERIYSVGEWFDAKQFVQLAEQEWATRTAANELWVAESASNSRIAT